MPGHPNAGRHRTQSTIATTACASEASRSVADHVVTTRFTMMTMFCSLGTYMCLSRSLVPWKHNRDSDGGGGGGGGGGNGMLPWSAEAPALRPVCRKRWGHAGLALSQVATAVWGLVVAAGAAFGSASSSWGLCPAEGGSEARWLGIVLALACAASLGAQAALQLGLAAWKELPRLLARPPKPARRAFMWMAMMTCSVGLVLGALTARLCASPELETLAGLTIACSVLGGGAFLVSRVIDLEVYQASESYDSFILHYARCLCWSSRTRRFVLVAVPFYAAMIVGLGYLGAAWGQVEPSACVQQERVYLAVATALLGVYSLLITIALGTSRAPYGTRRVLCCGGKRFAQGLLLFLILSSLIWGSVGGLLIFTTPRCAPGSGAVWHVVGGMHLLLVLLGGSLLCMSVLCNTESLLIDYYMYYDGDEDDSADLPLTNGFHQLILSSHEPEPVPPRALDQARPNGRPSLAASVVSGSPLTYRTDDEDDDADEDAEGRSGSGSGDQEALLGDDEQPDIVLR